MPTTVIKEILPAAQRKLLYAVYAFLGVAIGAIQVGFASAEAGQPTWLTVTLAVYAFVGGAFGITAAANTGQEVAVEEIPDGNGKHRAGL